MLSLALLRRQALPSPALACRCQQEHNGALQPPDPHGHEGGAYAPGRPRRSERSVRSPEYACRRTRLVFFFLRFLLLLCLLTVTDSLSKPLYNYILVSYCIQLWKKNSHMTIC